MVSYRGKDKTYWDKNIADVLERARQDLYALCSRYAEELKRDALHKILAQYELPALEKQPLQAYKKPLHPKPRKPRSTPRRLEQTVVAPVPSPFHELSDVVEQALDPVEPSESVITYSLPVPDTSIDEGDTSTRNGHDASLDLIPTGLMNSLGQSIAPVERDASPDDGIHDDEDDDTPTERYLDSIGYQPGARAEYRPSSSKIATRRLHDDSVRVYDLLLGARTADKATLYFKDGRMVHGALVFNPFKGTGRLINIDQEFSVDFEVDQLRDVKF